MPDESRADEYHETEVRVRYAETDQMGFAYYANALIWFEIGRTGMLRDRGYPYSQVEADGFRLPVVEVRVKYHAPARYEDLLVVQSRVTEVRASRVRFENRVVRASDRQLLIEGEVVLACLNAAGRPVRIPDRLRELLGP